MRSVRRNRLSMSCANSSPSNSLALVSSFYGHGAIACWYLTCLSCLLSWTFHLKKREFDSITSGFIALLIFPTVAVAHLVAQAQHFPPLPSRGETILEQMNAAISASLVIVETYLLICIILLVPTILIRSPD